MYPRICRERDRKELYSLTFLVIWEHATLPKSWKERAENRNDSASKSAQGEVLWDRLTQACFWLVKIPILTVIASGNWDTEPTRVCTAHIDWTVCCKFHLLMEYSCINVHLRPDSRNWRIKRAVFQRSLTFLWYAQPTPLFTRLPSGESLGQY